MIFTPTISINITTLTNFDAWMPFRDLNERDKWLGTSASSGWHRKNELKEEVVSELMHIEVCLHSCHTATMMITRNCHVTFQWLFGLVRASNWCLKTLKSRKLEEMPSFLVSKSSHSENISNLSVHLRSQLQHAPQSISALWEIKHETCTQ